jgi:amino acid permease
LPSDESALFSREELLGGPSARRSTLLLFAIENRTAHLLVREPQAVPIVLSERAATERERAFLDALAQGRDLPVHPTIQDLERYAPEWADLVPEDPGTRAGVAHLLGTKYAFTDHAVPRLRSALGLDVEAVEQAHQRLYGTPLPTIYAPRVRPVDRLRWAASRLAGQLDALPTFWLAFVITLIIGAVNLALPIAVAGVGALPGIALIVVLGIINVVTVAAMVEVVTRSGSIRYGNAFIGTVVADYLGGASSAILTLVLTAFSFGILLIFYIGISTTLADATALPAAAWMVVLFLVGLYFLTRGSLNATVASTIVITTINVGLLVALSAFAFSELQVENLTYVNLPWSPGGSFDPLLLGALVGVVLDIYAAHILVAIFGKMLHEREPSGRSVVRGHAAGIGFAMVLNVVWVLAVSGAIAPEVLAQQTSTVLVPLAAELGPHVRVLGAIFVILSMGLGLIQFSLALFSLARERIGERFSWGGSRGRFALSLTPVIGVLLVAEWMVLTGTGSFAGLLGFLGVMVHSLMSGIFPMLLLVASRRKGELVPGFSYRALGHPLVVGGVYLLFLSNLFLHGLVIWDHAVLRIGGVAIGLVMLVVTVGMIRRGAFAPRVVVELRQDQRRGERSRVTITAGGEPAAAEVRLTDAQGDRLLQGSTGELPELETLRSVWVTLPAGRARELKVWAHTISPDGISERLPVTVTLHDGDERRDLDLDRSGGQMVLPLKHEACRLEFTLAAPSAASVKAPQLDGAIA